jgi:hypothetical protein
VLFSRMRSTKVRASTCAVAVLALMVVGGVAAAGAQAGQWEWTGGFQKFGKESESLSEVAGSLTLSSKFLGRPIEIKCSKAQGTGSIGAGGSSHEQIKIGSCAVSKPARCELAGSLELNAIGQLIDKSGTPYVTYSPGNGQYFGIVTFVGTECALLGDSAEIKGSFASVAPTTPAVTQKFGYSTAADEMTGTAIRFGTEAAILSGDVEVTQSGALTNQQWNARPEEQLVEWAKTEPLAWTINGVKLGGSEPVTISSGYLDISMRLLGSNIEIDCAHPNSPIWRLQENGSASVEGFGASECHVVRPEKCSIGTAFSTAKLEASLSSVGGKLYEKFSTVGGGPLVTLRFSGAEGCALNGDTFEIKGTFSGYGEHYGQGYVNQPLEFTAALSNLRAGSESVSFTGGFLQALPSRLKWGVQ